jgi:hypothetical protein
MNSEELKSERKNIKLLKHIGLFGTVIFIGICTVCIGITSFLGWGLGQNLAYRHSILFFYLPQVGTFFLLAALIVYLVNAFKKQTVTIQKIYLPLFILFIYCSAVFAISHWIVYEYAIPTKVNNPENRVWSEAMIDRGLGGWPTGITCVLSDHVAALVDVWSFVTPNGHMPVLIWANNSSPNPNLPGNPVSCSQLQPNWYICYLTKPYQIVIDKYGLCDQRKNLEQK